MVRGRVPDFARTRRFRWRKLDLGNAGLAALTLTTVGIGWHSFNSNLYPYRISQPSSFDHIVLTDSTSRRIDYFFPRLLGSFTTNFNVVSDSGTTSTNNTTYLRGEGGHTIQRIGWVNLAHHRLALVKAHFKGLAGSWIIERVSFASRGRTWHLTSSYDVRYQNLRATLFRMMKSFRLR